MLPSAPKAAGPAADPNAIVASFNPLYRPYLVITIGLAMVCSIIGIPLALLWFCGVGQWWARHYFDLLECRIGDRVLWFCGVGQWWARHYFDLLECRIGDRVLRFRKGIIFQVEKTIPLENIQDVTFVEGPLLRRFNLATLKFETAGHSVGQAHDMQLTGIIDAHEFRNRILERRDALRHGTRPEASGASHGDAAGQAELLRAMLAKLDEIAALLRERRER